eukprot:TRINITY_DN866_c0_g1_i1.p1 TRINITY_DN866_c0_g1~~TRINITY_DN866_c0_g1_i1.p1  ORF type:complete len:346 (-),score=85.57 TRINITY_DN866_c0_g1_i1:77-1012(-)
MLLSRSLFHRVLARTTTTATTTATATATTTTAPIRQTIPPTAVISRKWLTTRACLRGGRVEQQQPLSHPQTSTYTSRFSSSFSISSSSSSFSRCNSSFLVANHHSNHTNNNSSNNNTSNNSNSNNNINHVNNDISSYMGIHNLSKGGSQVRFLSSSPVTTKKKSSNGTKAGNKKAKQAGETTDTPVYSASVNSGRESASSNSTAPPPPPPTKQKLGLTGYIKKFGTTFLVYWTGVWLVTGFALYFSVEALGPETSIEVLRAVKADKLIDLDDLNPKHGNMAIVIVVNECLEVVRLPFCVATLPLLLKVLKR